MKKNRKKLEKVSDKFMSDTFFIPVVGAEIEFYLKDTTEKQLRKICENLGIEVWDVREEEGEGQWEISIAHKSKSVDVADSILKIRDAIKDADFSAFPKEGGYGNSMQIHVSLLDKDCKNIFEKIGEDESDYLKYAISGLLETMPENMNVFAPYEKCYERFTNDRNAPSTISWGGNNRTVALRLPATTMQNFNRRIEHRVAAADADPYLVISAILEGVAYGILNKKMPQSEKIYGDASLDMYKLPKLNSCNS